MQSTPRMFLWAVVLSVLYAVHASAQPAYAITDYIVSGTGCPPGTVDAKISESGTGISLDYSKFVVQAGKGFTLSDGRKNCQITLVVDVPAGYQFSINKADYDGSYTLGANTTAIYTTTSYFQASIDQGTGSSHLDGPGSADSNTVSNTLSPAVWSACGKNALVNLNTAVRLSGATRSGQVTLNGLDLSAKSFVWKSC